MQLIPVTLAADSPCVDSISGAGPHTHTDSLDHIIMWSWDDQQGSELSHEEAGVSRVSYLLAPTLQYQDMHMRETIPVQKLVIIAI